MGSRMWEWKGSLTNYNDKYICDVISDDCPIDLLEIQVSMMADINGQDLPVLRVCDNGHGMTHGELVRMLSLGHRAPEDKSRIGMFGWGFKTGSMRIGDNALVLTQSAVTGVVSRSVGFLSRSFNSGKEAVFCLRSTREHSYWRRLTGIKI
eukprot:TRINITY_DN3913_c0_g1_i1.p1 TRINITY_DN3913_c0_g1~~TRINITY_DN3913_c0_g1_i1.p1  ORF type:complete len:151 (+),score=19.45 TRINITY_DN3913_c0_g1_i1:72-524(+)